MTTFAGRIAATLRLVVLQVLAAAAKEGVPDLNDAILRSAASDFGPTPDIGQMEQAVDWLASKELVAVRRVGEFRVVSLTDLGGDVAAGRVVLEGVRRPRIDA